ncbi:hypothetical protein C882_1851 [Caenispirillum salinarum AK4]|uniref:Uncharacterized protein n=1 Tax=Caenispirillum salinarum AK4 TaxID=1238182 RepID=K9GRI0_9PROT|nr:hypothetical protein [Caenispirillum salinarum]EKV27349.1 hypothetical protein C882_1851 [Caenispirillum salinarum AK4]
MADDSKNTDDIEVLEEGTIYFAFRPKVETHDPSGLKDVERFSMILVPSGRKSVRMAIIGRKRLPEIDSHEREWGFIETVGKDPKKLGQDLAEQHQDTKTRGERTYPAYRPAGQGVYAFVQKGRNMHLTYALSDPEKPGEVQKAFNIAPEGSFALSVKNPEKGQPRAAGLSDEDKADYPKSKQEEFEGRRFAPTDPSLLDYEGAEFVMVGARRDPEEDYDLDIEEKADKMSDERIFRHLHMAKTRNPVEPLFDGKWA